MSVADGRSTNVARWEYHAKIGQPLILRRSSTSIGTAFAHAQPYMGHDTPLIRIEWWKAPLTERLGRLAT